MTEADKPATKARLAFLKKLNVVAPRGLSKRSATDLIGTKLEPEPGVVERLKFFKVDTTAMTQTDARHALDRVMSDPANREKWKFRPAAKDQKAVLQFFDQVVPSGLNHHDAEKLVTDLLSDSAKADAWDAEQNRIDNIADLRETANDCAGDNGCKKLSAKLFKKAFESLSAAGVTVEQMEADGCIRLLARAAELDPTIIRDREKFDHFVLGQLKPERVSAQS